MCGAGNVWQIKYYGAIEIVIFLSFIWLRNLMFLFMGLFDASESFWTNNFSLMKAFRGFFGFSCEIKMCRYMLTSWFIELNF